LTVVAYARVSTVDQNPQLQIDALMEEGYDKAFTDKASGADRDRPELAKALAYLRHGDVLVFWKLDRLARSTVHLGQIAEHVRSKGAHLKCLTQPIDTTTPTGRMMFNILACFAEFERDIIVERTMAGLAAAKKQGRIGGWKKGRKRGARKRVLKPQVQEATA
jgi:DNA invertase Pin-like site-specific DNA recombinase